MSGTSPLARVCPCPAPSSRGFGLQVEEGPNLICGDTSSDIPMVEMAMALCPEKTCTIFCLEEGPKKKAIVDKLESICPRVLIVPSPDALVTIMYRCAQIRGGCVCPPNKIPLSVQSLIPSSPRTPITNQ